MNPTTTIGNINSDLYSKYYFYGWGRFRYSGILSESLFAYIILCICLFTKNFSVNGANNAVISTVERVFYLNSVESGLFLALYDLATVFSAPLVGYLGSLYSSPIFFSLNMIIIAIGNVLIASSNFIDRNNKVNLNWNNTQNPFTSNNVLFQCYNESVRTRENTTDSICLKEDYLSIAEKNAKFLLYAGNFINGIGSVALFTIGVPYIERIFPREKAAYCQGVYFAVGTVGGTLGIVATGRFLLLYTKFTSRRHIPSWLTSSHPLWIGCWWLPYFIYGSLCCLMSLVVSGLPNYGIPGKLDSVRNSTTEISAVASAQQQSIREQENDSKDNTMVMTCLKKPEIEKILRILLKGFVPFITKYFEYQHQLDTSTATLITGAIALLTVIIGCPAGAYFDE
ncbi:unnamed protein product [Rotaria socialis]|uniref:Solute carrier organic anion transporter family member n=1 Tax=Rotaria socialis TaxID=392032 RepID=A0A818ISJ0_9BILA|nr:unnamed protein product [Rotaria socialis]